MSAGLTRRPVLPELVVGHGLEAPPRLSLCVGLLGTGAHAPVSCPCRGVLTSRRGARSSCSAAMAPLVPSRGSAILVLTLLSTTVEAATEGCCKDLTCAPPLHKDKRQDWRPSCCTFGSCCRCWPGPAPPPPPPPVCVPGADVPAHKVPYFGFTEMLSRSNTEPGRGARFPGRSQQALNFAEGDKHIHLTYDVEHHDAPLLALDHDEECVESVVCTSHEEFVVTFCNATGASTAMVDFAGDGLLTGGSHWNCSEDGPGAPKVILRKTHGVSRDARDNRTLVFRTSQAKYHDFFKNAKVRFATNMWYDMHRHTIQEHENMRSDDIGATKIRQPPVRGFFDQGFPNFLRECAQTVKTIVSAFFGSSRHAPLVR